MIDDKGLEIGQSKPTIIAFTNSLGELGGGNVINAKEEEVKVPEKVYDIEVVFTELVDASDLSGAPFNPFIFINGNRGRECHLKDMTPTDNIDASFLTTQDDATDLSVDRSYVSQDKVPFAINIAHAFRYPQEGIRIDSAYNYFISWGESEGESFRDWYTDANGYRNTARIYMK